MVDSRHGILTSVGSPDSKRNKRGNLQVLSDVACHHCTKLSQRSSPSKHFNHDRPAPKLAISAGKPFASHRVGPSGHPLKPPSEPYVKVSLHTAQAFQRTYPVWHVRSVTDRPWLVRSSQRRLPWACLAVGLPWNSQGGIELETAFPCSTFVTGRVRSTLYTGGASFASGHVRKPDPDRLPFWSKPSTASCGSSQGWDCVTNTQSLEGTVERVT